MPTPVAHALAGVAVCLQASPRIARAPREISSVLALGVFVAIACLPDVDFILGFIAGVNLHHHFTHSVGATVLVAGISGMLGYLLNLRSGSAARFAWWVGIAYGSHMALDLFSKDTSPPYGMELLWPLSDRFIDGPWDLFDDIWRGSFAKLLGLHNWLAVAREIALVAPLVALSLWVSKRRARVTHSPEEKIG